MTVWDSIDSLAKNILGGGKASPVNLAEINSKIHRPTQFRNPDQQPVGKNTVSDIEVLPEYEFVLQSIKSEAPAIFVTGKAGTGKSTLIRYLKANLPRCAVVAPTAIAAINIQGATIHSFFSIPPRVINPEEVFEPSKHMTPVIKNLEVLIVDEVSMVSPNLIDCINNSLRAIHKNDKPFGGIRVVFVGDILQLPPVISDKEVGLYFTHRYESPYFYSAEVFKTTQILPVELKKVFRQQDPAFIELLDSIRTNRNAGDAISRINEKCHGNDAPMDDKALYLVPTNRAAAYLNDQKLRTLPGESSTYNAIIEGNLDPTKFNFPAPEKLTLKPGARVIFVRNHSGHLWINGTLGEVAGVSDDRISVKLIETGNIVSVGREKWERIRYDYNRAERKIETETIGSYSQFPLNLGWAITIHKSQGMTLSSICVDLGGGAFCAGQTYVALSRCKTLQGIRLKKPIMPNDVKVDPAIIEFYKRLGFLG
jgi:hypothetical protein